MCVSSGGFAYAMIHGRLSPVDTIRGTRLEEHASFDCSNIQRHISLSVGRLPFRELTLFIQQQEFWVVVADSIKKQAAIVCSVSCRSMV